MRAQPEYLAAGGGAASMAATGQGKFAYIDAVRGWAILLVMTCHVGGRFAEQFWPLKKLTNFGWHGVQLFFLASAITLCFSWHRSLDTYDRKVRHFFIRRFLRIAPMYYFGALLYIVAWPPGPEFTLSQLLRTVMFINAWSPAWVPTDGGWMVVPGGWSIGVEFTFYALFPFLIVVLTSLRRAVIFALAVIPVAVVANAVGKGVFGEFDGQAVANFLYFWFPNQLPVFAIGIVLYHVMVKYESVRLRPVATWLALTAVVGACLALAINPAASDRFSTDGVPQILAVALAFSAFVLVLSASRDTLFVHPAIQRIGVLSFSCYVLHFLFVHGIPSWTGGLIDTSASGTRAAFMTVLLWIFAVPATLVAAELANRWIEQPGIRLAQYLTRRRQREALAAE